MASDIEKAGENLPRKRVSTSARQAAADLLSAALADGQLNIDEFDDRNKQLWCVTYVNELEKLTADLSFPASASQVPFPAVIPSTGGASLTLSVMGGSSREGSWQIAPHHHSFTTMGGNLLDLRFAKLSAQETVINAVAIMGGMEIIVPENVRVISEGLGIMGGFGIEDHPSCSISMNDLPPNAPTIRIRGLGLMGGVGIVRAARDARVH